MFGVLWVFLSPLLLLWIFAFVFGEIFQARWTQQLDGPPFWLTLYSGLIVFNFFADTVSRAPTTIRSYPSYVKKIIFPLEILPLVPLGAGLVHGSFNLFIFAAAMLYLGHATAGLLLFPLLVIPALLLGMGLAWFLAAWGVYIKDMAQIVPLFLQMLLFLSPVFYPASAVPTALRPVYALNPLAVVIEATRAAMLNQVLPWSNWALALAFGLLVAWAGFAFFQHSRDEFADVM